VRPRPAKVIKTRFVTEKSFWKEVHTAETVNPLGKHNTLGALEYESRKQRRQQHRKLGQSLSRESCRCSNLPQEQLSKPHGEGPVLFALNCNTMPKYLSQQFGPGDDLRAGEPLREI
jgi:hypothetical protein